MLHMSSMTNGYVRKDMNRESNFFSNAEGQEHLLMADGTAMSADAFRDAHPTTKFTPEELGVDMTPTVEVLKVEAPAERQAGIKVESVEQLVDKLKNEAKVIS